MSETVKGEVYKRGVVGNRVERLLWFLNGDPVQKRDPCPLDSEEVTAELVGLAEAIDDLMDDEDYIASLRAMDPEALARDESQQAVGVLVTVLIQASMFRGNAKYTDLVRTVLGL